jgi:phenylacetate-CoA ligase
MSCEHECGMHIWDDYIYCEIVDPKTGELVPDGEIGELVITTLCKEGAPLIRYRTHDLTRFLPGDCACGSPFPRIDTLIGRTDDMVKVKGVNIFPSQIDEMLKNVPCASSEYQFMLDHMNGKDECRLFVELNPGYEPKEAAGEIGREFKTHIGISVMVLPVNLGDLPRSEKKSTRVFDNRY